MHGRVAHHPSLPAGQPLGAAWTLKRNRGGVIISPPAAAGGALSKGGGILARTGALRGVGVAQRHTVSRFDQSLGGGGVKFQLCSTPAYYVSVKFYEQLCVKEALH